MNKIKLLLFTFIFVGLGFLALPNTTNSVYAKGEELTAEQFKLSMSNNNEVDQTNKNFPDVYLDSVEDLPITTGNPNNAVGRMGVVSFFVYKDNAVLISIAYDGEIYNIRKDFAKDEDMDLIFKDNAYYFTERGNKFLAMSHHETYHMLRPTMDYDGFEAYTIWNLTTNDTVLFDKVRAYLYVKNENTATNDIYGYFYLEDFYIEELTSISFEYNFKWDRWIGGDRNWNTLEKTVLQDESYRTHQPWVWQYIKFMFAKSDEITPFDEEIVKGITEVDRSTPEGKRQEAEAFMEFDKKWESFDKDSIGDKKLFRIFMNSHGSKIAQDALLGRELAIDQESIEVITFSYMKDGFINSVDGKDIDLKPTIDDSLNPRDPSWIDKILRWFLEDPIRIVIGLVLIISLPTLITIIPVIIGLVVSLIKIPLQLLNKLLNVLRKKKKKNKDKDD